jgi:hypothetical protein
VKIPHGYGATVSKCRDQFWDIGKIGDFLSIDPEPASDRCEITVPKHCAIERKTL